MMNCDGYRHIAQGLLLSRKKAVKKLGSSHLNQALSIIKENLLFVFLVVVGDGLHLLS